MTNGFDSGSTISSTLRKITKKLALLLIPLVVCTDNYSLYECLVNLGTPKDKRLKIYIMALRQSYERREISEIRLTHCEDNLADSTTKNPQNKALEHFAASNKLTFRIEDFV